MELNLLSNLALGFTTVLSVENLFYCLLGVTLGTTIGVLPGIGPLAAISLLLPLTYQFNDPTTSLIMLAGIYYGCQYGGSTTAILINMPGEPSSVITTTDGYQLSRQGKAGKGLAVAAISSFIGGTFATLLIATFALPLTKMAFLFGPAEYFNLMVLGLVIAVAVANKSVLKAMLMVLSGILLGLVGTDVTTGMARYTFGIPELYDGISFAIVAIGMFGIAEVIYNMNNLTTRDSNFKKDIDLSINKNDFSRFIPSALRGTAIGSLLGVLPGSGGIISSFAAYAFEKKISKNRDEFGKGAIEGVAAPEAANNAGAQTSFIPMLTLGIPTTPIMALMIAAMMIHNVVPGPQVTTTNPGLFWGLIVSMWIGNVMLLILNLPLIGIWIRLLRVRYQILYPVILFFSCLGAYTLTNNAWSIFLLIPFSILGYYLKKWDCEPAPLLMGFVVGPMLEENLRRALIISNGDWVGLFTHPISMLLIAISLIVIFLMFVIRKY
jgi:putative tricarboxylic transport membrane protein